MVKIKSHSLSMTANNRVGTPLWRAPEVIKNEPYAEKVDIYSLALVIWEIMTNRLPYDGLDEMQLMYAVVVKGQRPDLPVVD